MLARVLEFNKCLPPRSLGTLIRVPLHLSFPLSSQVFSRNSRVIPEIMLKISLSFNSLAEISALTLLWLFCQAIWFNGTFLLLFRAALSAFIGN